MRHYSSARASNDKFDKSLAAAEEELRAHVARISALETGLVTAGSVKTLEIRGREVSKCKESVVKGLVQVVARMVKFTEDEHASILSSTAKFKADTFKTHDEGGAYAPECIEEYSRQLDQVDAAAGASKDKHAVAVEAMEAAMSEAAEAAYESFNTSTPFHKVRAVQAQP